MVRKPLTTLLGIISGGFILLATVFPDATSELIISIFGVSSVDFVFYALIGLALLGIFGSAIILLFDKYSLSISILKTTKRAHPHFEYLTIHYSQKGDTPDTPKPARPRYVTNNKTKQAYWIPELLEPYIKQGLFSWDTYDGGDALLSDLKKQHYKINSTYPSLEELGLYVKWNKKLTTTEDVQMVIKLRGHKLDDWRLIYLYPLHRYIHMWFRKTPPNARLLLKVSINQTFIPPPNDLELVYKRIIQHYSKIKYPFESVKRWSERHNYEYMGRSINEEELINELRKR